MQGVVGASAWASRRGIVAVGQQFPAVIAATTAVARKLNQVMFPLTRSPLHPATGAPRRRTLASAVALDGEREGEGGGDTQKRRRRPKRDRPAPITLTDRAAAHLTHLMANKPDTIGVRLGVKRRGCNGLSYTLKYADERPKGDEVVIIPAVPTEPKSGPELAVLEAKLVAAGGEEVLEEGARGAGDKGGAAIVEGGLGVTTPQSVTLFVDPMATLYIAGTVMDWEETELSSEFTFRNPNAKGECGCGESFNV